MPRIIVLLVVLVLIIGTLFLLSSLPKQRPTQVIEVPVAQTGPAGGNAH